MRPYGTAAGTPILNDRRPEDGITRYRVGTQFIVYISPEDI